MVVMGRVTAPFGVQGWIKVYALTAQLGNLQDYPVWWLGHEGDWRQMQVAHAKVHGGALVAKLVGISDRDQAIGLKGLEVAVPRSELPAAAANEYYWADLIGLRVVNTQHHEFGCVARILETGANDVLVIEGERETLIPFIDEVIKAVDLAAGTITVAWGEDY